jgi:hypothetical protein
VAAEQNRKEGDASVHHLIDSPLRFGQLSADNLQSTLGFLTQAGFPWSVKAAQYLAQAGRADLLRKFHNHIDWHRPELLLHAASCGDVDTLQYCMQNIDESVLNMKVLEYCMFYLGTQGHMAAMTWFLEQYRPPALTQVWDMVADWPIAQRETSRTPIWPVDSLQWVFEQEAAE